MEIIKYLLIYSGIISTGIIAVLLTDAFIRLIIKVIKGN